jgi:hypothetical protein
MSGALADKARRLQDMLRATPALATAAAASASSTSNDTAAAPSDAALVAMVESLFVPPSFSSASALWQALSAFSS